MARALDGMEEISGGCGEVGGGVMVVVFVVDGRLWMLEDEMYWRTM